MALNNQYSVVIQNKLFAKFNDLGSFLIPCLIENVCIDRALYDLGSTVSLIPLSIPTILYNW